MARYSTPGASSDPGITCTVSGTIVDGSNEKPEANEDCGPLEVFLSTLETAVYAPEERLKNGMSGLTVLVKAALLSHFLYW